MSQNRVVIRVVVLCMLLACWGVIQSQMNPSVNKSTTDSTPVAFTSHQPVKHHSALKNNRHDTDIQLTKSTEERKVKESTFPKLLPRSKNANPIKADSPSLLKEKQNVIQQEMPHASEEEKKIWLDTFKGLPAQALRDMLRTRKMIGPLVQPNKTSSAAQHLRSQNSHSSGSQQTLQTAIVAMEQAMQVTMNNIANAHTFGFKRTQTFLTDLPYQRINIPAPIVSKTKAEQNTSATELEIGLGVQIEKTELDMTAGNIKQTKRELDIAIVGKGFIQVKTDDGNIFFTRNGHLQVNREGTLVYLIAGHEFSIEPLIQLPQERIAVHISKKGEVTIDVMSDKKKIKTVVTGQLKLAVFTVPSRLKQLGGGLYATTEASGTAGVKSPGSQHCGVIQQGSLECSNVNVDDEVTTLKQYRKQIKTLLELQQDVR